MKILFVIDTLEIGGTEQSLLELVSHLNREQFHSVVCSVYSGNTLAAQLEDTGARVVPLNINGKYRFPTSVQRLRQVIREELPDLVHTMLFRAGQVGRVSARLHGIPVVSSFVSVPYDASRISADQNAKRWKNRCLQLLDASTARLTTRFHAVSETAKRINCRDLKVAEGRVTVIPRGRDVEPYLQNSERRQANERPRVINVGRLTAPKGQCHLVNAIGKVLQNRIEVELAIAGKGQEQMALVAQIERLGLQTHVSLLGSRDDIPELLRQADVFAFPSLYEGLPGALIEAMLAGCPIVASDIPQIAEMLENEKTGLLVPAGDEQALADGICRLIEDRELATQLGEEARRVAVARYDIEVVTRQMEEFYRSVVETTGRTNLHQ